MKKLHLYNTLNKQKELFTPIHPQKVSMYVCGPTVYDFFHIGNARVFVIFDMLARFLRFEGYEVNYARNITDIDDKIIERAANLGISTKELTEKFTLALHEDEKKLGNLSPTLEPKASSHIVDIIKMIETLLAKNYAYIATNGDVYYEVSKFKNYGLLAQQDLHKLRQGARVEVVSVKKDPLDFVLWKQAKRNEPAWDSPWGKGRPGWHSECAAMSNLHLGRCFDIHGGGADLKFPHHQNEVAQAEAIMGQCCVHYWMHVGFVEINKEKMSKSKGNFSTVHDLLKIYHPETLRFFILNSHYRSPLDYSAENLESSHAALKRFYTALQDLNISSKNITEENIAKILTNDANLQKFADDFYEAMHDDLNTPAAFSALFELTRQLNKLREEQKITKAENYAVLLLHFMQNVFGLLKEKPEHFLHAGLHVPSDTAYDDNKISELISERKIARKNKNWQRADQIRDELLAAGIELEDKIEETSWKRK